MTGGVWSDIWDVWDCHVNVSILDTISTYPSTPKLYPCTRLCPSERFIAKLVSISIYHSSFRLISYRTCMFMGVRDQHTQVEGAPPCTLTRRSTLTYTFFEIWNSVVILWVFWGVKTVNLGNPRVPPPYVYIYIYILDLRIQGRLFHGKSIYGWFGGTCTYGTPPANPRPYWGPNLFLHEVLQCPFFVKAQKQTLQGARRFFVSAPKTSQDW